MAEEQSAKTIPGAIHLGTMRVGHKGPGTYLGGVVKLQANRESDLLASAVSFLKAADRCLNGGKIEPGVELLLEPGTVCAALSCELFLKYVVLRERGETPIGHDLSLLFRQCSLESRTALSEHTPQIAEILDRDSNHFVDGRYHHEQDQFSFRQAELLQAAEALSGFVRQLFCEGGAANQSELEIKKGRGT
jgi:HEPN domain-containing protein